MVPVQKSIAKSQADEHVKDCKPDLIEGGDEDSPLDASVFPSGENFTADTARSCPRRTYFSAKGMLEHGFWRERPALEMIIRAGRKDV
jgi:hypothetical protein